jgi:hypothetical protein
MLLIFLKCVQNGLLNVTTGVVCECIQTIVFVIGCFEIKMIANDNF